MFATRFASKETGEDFWMNVYESKEEAKFSRDISEYPGYGTTSIIEVSEEEALEYLVDSIGEEIYIQLEENGANCEPDYDGSIEEGYWFKEVNYRIANKLPGWQLLKRHYN